ncbi:Rep [Pollentivirus pleritis]|uniref:Replication-associated protein n=1 Tax=Bat circovirus TaxID=1329650 RepID=A0A0D3MDS8_9CIRC|nr:Rep [Bat circovirus]
MYLRNFVFTLNNYTEDEYNFIKNFEQAQYIIIGKETGAQGTPHLQGYMELKKQVRFNTVKSVFPRMHIEPRRGTQKQAVDYCKKEKNFIEVGKAKMGGIRNDVASVIEFKNSSFKSFFESSPGADIQAFNLLGKIKTYMEEKRDYKTFVIWCYGPSGSGKSRWAYEISRKYNPYFKDDTKWWDGYDNNSVTILDDFRASNMKFNTLLKLLDRYPYLIEIKGGYRQFVSSIIIITCIQKHEDTYKILENDEPLNQLTRRINKIMSFPLQNHVTMEEIISESEIRDDPDEEHESEGQFGAVGNTIRQRLSVVT